VSVLEHIPAPADQQAVTEMIRVLKPGGLVLMTVDYAPDSGHRAGRMAHYARRVGSLLQTDGVAGLRAAALVRKREAAKAAHTGAATVARAANQPFDWRHLTRDILPRITAESVPWMVSSGTATDPTTIGGRDVRTFWDLEPGLFERQGRRPIVPVALALRRPTS
jgi:hypothetical protein